LCSLWSTSSFAQNCLIADFPFTGNAQDATGNGNNGVLIGSPSLVMDRANTANAAYNFSASDGIEVNNTLGNFGVGDFSISCWVKTIIAGGGATARFISKRETCNTGAPFIQMGVGTLGNLVLEFNENNNYSGINTGEGVNDGNWRHIVLTRQGADHNIYIDNSFFTTHVTPGIYDYSNNAVLEFGKDVCTGVSTGVKYEGDLDNIKFYNCAISTIKIDSLFNYDFPISTVSTKDYFKSNIKIYPNPTKGQLTIENENTNGQLFNFSISNALGEMVYTTQPFSFPHTIHFNDNIASGIYVLKIYGRMNELLDIRKINVK